MHIDEKTVRKIADLSRLEIKDEQVRTKKAWAKFCLGLSSFQKLIPMA